MTDLEKQSARADEAALRKELESAGARFKGRNCVCPFHDDHSPSAWIKFKMGAWKFHCAVCEWGGDIFDVRARLNKRTVAEELSGGRRASTPAEKPKVTYPSIAAAVKNFNVIATHRYRLNDVLHVAVVRFWKEPGKKGIIQLKPIPGGFVFGGPAAPHPLYMVDCITPETREIIVVEGEKKADALRKLGFAVVTSLGGAGKASHTDWQPLAGKMVYLWADADKPSEQHPDGVGVEHMRDVQRLCATLVPPPRIYRVAHEELDLPDGGDADDFIARYAGWADADIAAVVRDEVLARAIPVGIGADYQRHIDEGIAGMRRTWPWPWAQLGECNALMPATVTVLCGDPKAGKSILIMQAMVVWTAMGIRACVKELEDGRNYHLNRGHAQIIKDSRILDPRWLEANPEAARIATETAMTELEELGRVIYEPPQNECESHEMLLAWIEARAKEGFVIIVVDPFTAAKPEPKPWIADHAFIHAAKRIAEKYRVCPIIVIHPEKGHKGGGGGGQLAGGAAIARFCHTLLWLDQVSEDATSTVKDADGLVSEQRVNRTLRIVFARNGPGSNKRIAMNFDWRTMLFNELGTML